MRTNSNRIAVIILAIGLVVALVVAFFGTFSKWPGSVWLVIGLGILGVVALFAITALIKLRRRS